MKQAKSCLVVVTLCIPVFQACAPARAGQKNTSLLPAFDAPPRLASYKLSASGDDVEIIDRVVDVSVLDKFRGEVKISRDFRFLTDYALDVYGDPRIVHRADRQKLEVVQACGGPDHNPVRSSCNAVTDTIPFGLDKAPGYSFMRETVVTLLGLGRGAVGSIGYQVKDIKPRALPFCKEIPIDLPGTIDKFELQVDAKNGTEFTYDCVGCTSPKLEIGKRPRVENKDGIHKIKWLFKNIPPAYQDKISHHRVFNGLAPGQARLVVSAAGGWNELGRMFTSLFDKAVDQGGRAGEKALEIASGQPTATQAVERVLDFVANGLANVGYSPLVAYLEPVAADTVLERGYATMLDKAVLLTAMLKKLGYDPRPILVSRDRKISRKAACQSQFDKVLIAIDKMGWISPTSGSSKDRRSLLSGLWAFDPASGEIEKIKPLKPGNNLFALDIDLTLDRNKAGRFKVSVTLAGAHADYYSLKKADKGACSLASKMASSILAGSKVKKCKVNRMDEGMISLEIEAGLDHLIIENSRFLKIVLPIFESSVLSGKDIFAPDERRTALGLPFPTLEQLKISVHYPDSFHIRMMPHNFEYKAGGGTARLQVTRKKGLIVLKRELMLGKRWIEPKDYRAFKKAMAPVTKAKPVALLFEL
ncbi:MAG: DUF3858 domain-containing protein [Deltaproteobacteria bacterium]|nr:DUF3858 domain-containing protein [Deltaproteobacteria bacterium]